MFEKDSGFFFFCIVLVLISSSRFSLGNTDIIKYVLLDELNIQAEKYGFYNKVKTFSI